MFGFISKRHHEAVIASKDAQIALLEKELADRRQGEHRLTDLVFKHQFNEQVYDSLPKESDALAPEPELSAVKKLEEEYKQEQATTAAELRALAKSNPSKLGARISAEMRKRREHSVRAAHPANQLFAQAAAEVK